AIVDADGLEAIAAHRTAAAGEEQLVGWNFRQIRPQQCPRLEPASQHAGIVLAEAEIGAALDSQPGAGIAVIELVERLEIDLPVPAFGRVDAVIAEIQRCPGIKTRGLEVARAEIVIEPVELELRPALDGDLVGE